MLTRFTAQTLRNVQPGEQVRYRYSLWGDGFCVSIREEATGPGSCERLRQSFDYSNRRASTRFRSEARRAG
jgi:hypothetical protein